MFIEYLDKINALKKERKYDEAWRIANIAVIDLRNSKDDMWYMMYYQMADIQAREKKYFEALESMGIMIHYMRGVGGTTHKKFIQRLLKKFSKEKLYSEYLNTSIKTKPDVLRQKLQIILK